ncbi:MAG: Gfo/Idh/MocA family oxidoreductase [Planctomycetes bacterium]|nr:Gfo/Idh/MocA family oxidoreductase [Planctomycetota bacterium]
MIGTGFWARYQLAGWRELRGAWCAALYNRTRSKAEALAREFGVPAVYDDAEQLLRSEQLDFVDIVTDVGTHRRFVEMAAAHRLPIVCQKPMAPTLTDAQAMIDACRQANVPLYIHENWRWQEPIRQFKRVLDEGRIGRVFRARIQYSNSFPVFDNQPFLRELEEFILTDIGTHILDTARFLFGEARRLYCQVSRVHADIRGEDVATVMMETGDRATVVCEMSYASRVEHDRFPETFILAEGDRGSAELRPDYWIRVTTADGTHSRRCPPPRYAWADPRYDCVHASIVSCNADMLRALQTGGEPETHAEDNLRTLRLVFGSYESARTHQAVAVD